MERTSRDHVRYPKPCTFTLIYICVQPHLCGCSVRPSTLNNDRLTYHRVRDSGYRSDVVTLDVVTLTGPLTPNLDSGESGQHVACFSKTAASSTPRIPTKWARGSPRMVSTVNLYGARNCFSPSAQTQHAKVMIRKARDGPIGQVQEQLIGGEVALELTQTSAICLASRS